LGRYKFKGHYYISPVNEPLFFLILCIPFCFLEIAFPIITRKKQFYISEKDDAFKMEFEFSSPKQFEARYNLRTLGMYTLESSLQEFNDSIKK
jgi:hypothetical protein